MKKFEKIENSRFCTDMISIFRLKIADTIWFEFQSDETFLMIGLPGNYFVWALKGDHRREIEENIELAEIEVLNHFLKKATPIK